MIGLIFGETNFPREILKKIKRKNLKFIIIDLTKKKNFIREKNSYTVSIGQFGKIIAILKIPVNSIYILIFGIGKKTQIVF